ncbi:LemA family protein [bacterium]|nr:LemA family protein [bacterium]
MYILIAIVILICLYGISVYNKGVQLRNFVREAFSTMDVYLKKRWDLIPNLVETVKGYSDHEKSVFTELTNLRTKNYEGMSDNEKLQTNAQINSVLPKLLAVAENYPDLKANESYNQLMNNLSGIENEIANARKYYNGTVRELNTFTEIFPSNIFCSIFSIHPAELFEISDSERENVKVNFS